MKLRYSLIVMPVLLSILSAQARYSPKTVIAYAKAIDVATLDPSLSSIRLDEWLRSGAPHLGEAIWEVGDCDLKPRPIQAK